MNTTEAGLIGFFILTSIFTLSAQCFIAHKFTDLFESLLPNCKYIADNKQLYKQAGLPGKLIRTGSISLVLAIPKLFIWRGLANAEEVKAFPQKHRRILLCLLALHLTLLSALVLSHFLFPAQ
ncbi:TPA: hypothetical protein QEM39_002442 [Pseudomonas putida]|uniref:hypothetical protein n=1 Tax=Pseudomonas putida TaxID=303 RepID=UPI0023632E85|nr:hypothetical protein [Pseudomonas putida]MDD2150199.1 hypothetical protein [Pseudomonas putida]HDS1680901.1 hypothetical protein [Pseudomonas putida]